MKGLPLELKQEITLYLGFIKTVDLFPEIAHYIYNKEKYTWYHVVYKSNLNILKWLHRNRIEGCTKDVMDWAANDGHIETVRWLHQNRTEGCTKRAMNWTKYEGHTEIVKYLKENNLVK